MGIFYKAVKTISKKVLITVGVLVFVACACIVVFSLFQYGVISFKEPKKIELDNLGSASELEGNVGIVSIFASDDYYKWDFSSAADREKRDSIFRYTAIATEWLTEQAKKYGKTLTWSAAENEDSDFYYESTFKGQCAANNKVLYREVPEEWAYIDKNIDNDTLRSKYNCKNMVYLIFVNSDDESSNSAFAFYVYDEPLEYGYEIAYLPTEFGGTVLSPSVIAHEMLHLFGAPDLYNIDGAGLNYQIKFDYIVYCRNEHKNEIMMTTFSIADGEKKSLTDRIDNDLTDITAYYIGWLDEAPAEVDEYSLVHSQHEYYRQHKQDKD